MEDLFRSILIFWLSIFFVFIQLSPLKYHIDKIGISNLTGRSSCNGASEYFSQRYLHLKKAILNERATTVVKGNIAVVEELAAET